MPPHRRYPKRASRKVLSGVMNDYEIGFTGCRLGQEREEKMSQRRVMFAMLGVVLVVASIQAGVWQGTVIYVTCWRVNL